MQMAIDEALLHAQKVPTLRFYRWRAPAVSFGYFSQFGDVSKYSPERELVRRWTGGGIVLHGEDLTYAVIIPATGSAFFGSPQEIYTFVHAGIQKALQSAGLHATLAGEGAPKISDACFANPVRADVMLDGAKIAGAAQRRTRAGLLHQGSIQVAELGEDFVATLAAHLCPKFERKSLPARVIGTADRIARTKYETRAWLTRR